MATDKQIEERLKRISEAALETVRAHPEGAKSVQVIVFVHDTEPNAAGMGLLGYEDEHEAFGALMNYIGNLVLLRMAEDTAGVGETQTPDGEELSF